MDKKQAESIIASHARAIYGFVLKRCAHLQDAEDISQDIVLRAYNALLNRNDIDEAEKYIWAIAHNTLTNHYRTHRRGIGISLDDAILPVQPDYICADIIERESISRLQKEIAYLSTLQRRIVIAYYYDNMKQSEIAAMLGISIGTVKWHLFEARSELKRGMEKMRTASKLKFNPIRFSICGTNGSVGEMGGNYRAFRSTLSQNIAYALWHKPMTVNELADALGVSPVYIESEAEFLHEYGYLLKNGSRYLCNILIEEFNQELANLHNIMYRKAAEIFANELYDTLLSADVMNWEGISGGYANGNRDINQVLWSLIPYIASQSGESLMDNSVSFDEAATLRKDGAHNICYAVIEQPTEQLPVYFESMQHWCGPCWNADDNIKLWLIDSEWSDKRVTERYDTQAADDMRLLNILIKAPDTLSEYELALLAQRGYISITGTHEINTRFVHIHDKETEDRLLHMGDEIRLRFKAAMDELKAPYVKAVMANVPTHLTKMKQYGMQYIFYADGWFILNCLKVLVENGKLRIPVSEQRNALTTLVISK